jgi:peptide/nickel transport system permease protein
MRRFWIGAVGLAIICLLALLAPILPIPDPIKQNVAERLQGPNWMALLGKDEVGRDVLSRLIWGARNSLTFALTSVLIAGTIGTAIGMAGGWFRGWAERIAMGAAEIILCFPSLLFALLIIVLIGPGTGTLIFVMSVLLIPGFVRVAFGETLSARNQDYVEAVRALGASAPRIIVRTLLPNIAGPLLVQFSSTICGAMIMEAALSFLGLGVLAPAPSWGRMIAAARTVMDREPLLLVWPCLGLVFTILAMNAVCDGLRDIVDPHARRERPKRRIIDHLLPGLVPAAREPAQGALLSVTGLTVEIATPRGPVVPVSDVGFSVQRGEVLAIVGESGSGKSLTAAAIMGLLPPAAQPVAGSVRLDGREILGVPEVELRTLRGRAMAIVFQDPLSSLHPMQCVGDQLVEAIRVHQKITHRAAARQALALFRRVGIPDPERRLKGFAHEMSGGMRQRVMIAMAVANTPSLLIADEPTTALDVTVQAQIMDLLADLRRETGMAMIFISHNLALVAEIATSIVVMYAGEVVEHGPVDRVFAAPRHPYTKALLEAVPRDDRVPTGIAGTVPAAGAPVAGCRFATRCGYAADICRTTTPALEADGDGRLVRCLRWDALARTEVAA